MLGVVAWVKLVAQLFSTEARHNYYILNLFLHPSHAWPRTIKLILDDLYARRLSMNLLCFILESTSYTRSSCYRVVCMGCWNDDNFTIDLCVCFFLTNVMFLFTGSSFTLLVMGVPSLCLVVLMRIITLETLPSLPSSLTILDFGR